LGVLSLALLPAEHVHVAHEHDGYHADVVHRHFAPHHAAGSASLADYDDPDVHWLSSWFTAPQPAPLPASVDFVEAELSLLLPPQLTCERSVRIDDVSVHDPPPVTPSGLRAPPSFSV
jgi:hypothetical protein